MLEIKVMNDGEERRKLLLQAGMENGEVMAAFDGDAVTEYTVFTLDDESAVIRYISSEKPMMADGMLRSTIHVALCRGKSSVYYAETVSEKLMEKLGFIKDKSKRLLNCEKLFSSCCCEK